jgi:hypothetical protein
MLTLSELRDNVNWRCTMELEMDHGAYERHFQSNTYPRLRMIHKLGPKTDPMQSRNPAVKFLVDFLECKTEQAVVNALNGPPVPFANAPH